MKTNFIKFGIMIILFVLFSGIVSAVDCIDESGCTLTGNHYVCTGTFTDCGGFYSDTYSIYISDATITQTGDAGGIGIVGGSGSINIYSSDKVKLEDVTLTTTGGSGGTASGTTYNGGIGGIAGLNITAPYVYLDNITLTATSGIGGNGYASASRDGDGDCQGHEDGDAGAGGAIYIDINAETSFTSYNNTYTLNTGIGGNGDSDACTDEQKYNARCDSAEGEAGAGGIIYFNVDTNLSDVQEIVITGTGGAGGIPSGSVDCQCDGEGEDDHSAKVYGGKGGYATIDFNAVNLTGDDITIDLTAGLNQNSYVRTEVTACGGDDKEAANAQDGQSGGPLTVTFESDYLYLSNIDSDLTGSSGSAADCDTDTDGSGSSDKDHDRGGTGSLIYYYLYANTEGTISNSDFTSTAGSGGAGDGCGTGTFDYDGEGGHGGSVYAYMKNLAATNVTTTSTGGAGYIRDGYGKGGNGGANYLYLYGDNTFDADCNIQMAPGVGGAGQSVDCGYFGCGGGNGGSAYIYNYGDTVFTGSTVNATAATAGLGTQCSSATFAPYVADLGNGGNSKIITTGEITFDDADVTMYGGVGSCSLGGDSEVNSTDAITFTDTGLTMEMGDSVSGTHGGCNIYLNGDYSSQDTNITCNSADSLGTAQILGTAMDKFDYREDTNITFNGAISIVNLTYSGAIQKFLTWDSVFPATYVYWDCDVAKYGNRSPISSAVTFNETCTTLDYDYYSTDLSSLEQAYVDGTTAKTKPYSYVNYTCSALVTFPTDTINTIKANFTWLVNGSATSYSETGATLISGTTYTSSAILNSTEVTIGANTSCKIDLLSDTTLMYADYDNETVVPAYHNNFMIDIGNDSTVDYTGTGDFIGVLTQTEADGAGLNAYLRDCDTTTCVIPIKFYSDEDSQITINDLYAYYGVSSPEDDIYNLTLDIFSSEAGTLDVDDIEITYDFGDGDTVNITAEIIGPTTTDTESYLVTIVESIFDVAFPTLTTIFEMYPNSPTAKDVEPVGQTSGTAIFTVTNDHATESEDIYVKLQDSWDSMGLPCTELELSIDNVASGSPNISTTGVVFCDNVSAGGTCSLWAYQDFACTWSQFASAYYSPTFLFDSMCSDCVLTYDYLD